MSKKGLKLGVALAAGAGAAAMLAKTSQENKEIKETKAKKATLATAMAMTGLLAMTQQAAAYEAGGGNTNHSCTFFLHT